MKEIEILYTLQTDIEVAKKLLTEKVGFVEEIIVHDWYYARHDIKDLLPDEEGRLHSALRLRKKGNEHYITYKNDHFDNNETWLFSDEHETLVGDILVMRDIFSKLLFTELVQVLNKKFYYQNDNYEIVLEDVFSLGHFIEIEFKGDTKNLSYDDIQKKKEEMRLFLKLIGIETGEEMNAGKPELLLQKNKERK
ncbi:MAG: class IV adenylate cyclase [Patescibacteria group bacterium]|nr:class IV adenylate cyclase [Patescibacteria group bacterium]MDD3435090.1 class IV adenylate cyclase [Patescibacteria group bacterium]MDD4466525.1 class IV adenylate cyclase [Patescibacteria group bacterium]